MELGLANKVVLVTASSKGIGRAIAEAFAREKARVVMCARDEAALNDAAAKIKQATGAEVLPLVCDLTSAESIENLVFEAGKQLGPIEVLVANAGGPPEGGYFQVTDDDWWEGFQLNFMSIVMLLRNVAPGMKAREWGRVIAIESTSARQPLEGMTVSNAVRAGVLGFAKSVSQEFAPYGITVNTILPGYTETNRLAQLAQEKAQFKKTTPQEVVKEWQAQVPAGRLGKPQDIAALALFLASVPAGYVTGQAIAVDGGLIKSV
ncbi:MAG TPA: SDR family oxidoreductase [Oscillatoriaceae cyanobacterium]